MSSKIRKTALTTTLYLLVIISLFCPVLNASISRFTYLQTGAKYRSLLTDYEFKAVEEYISKLPVNVRIISDPFTMIYFTAFTNRIGLVDQTMAPFADKYKSQKVISTIWYNIFHNKSAEAYTTIASLKDVIPNDEQHFLERIQMPVDLSQYIIIVSGRTAWWLDKGDPFGWYTLFPQNYKVNTSHIIDFLDPRYFNLEYKIDENMYIFTAEESDITIQPVTRNNVLYMPLDGIIDSQTKDESNFGNNGIIHDATLVNGKVESALSFNGLDNHVEVPDSESLKTSTFTIDFWFYRRSHDANYEGLIDKWTQAYQGILIESCRDGRIRVILGRGGSDSNYSVLYSSVLNNNMWHHLVLTYDELNATLYINAMANPSVSTTFEASQNSLLIGCRQRGVTGYFDGIIDEVRIYTRALSLEEIYNNYFWGN